MSSLIATENVTNFNVLTIVIEAIWWIATLVIMFLLFKQEYDGFVKAVLDLEGADRRLRGMTNNISLEPGNNTDQEKLS